MCIRDSGYAIVSNETGILKEASAAPEGSRIHVRLAKGEMDARVSRDSPSKSTDPDVKPAP